MQRKNSATTSKTKKKGRGLRRRKKRKKTIDKKETRPFALFFFGRSIHRLASTYLGVALKVIVRGNGGDDKVVLADAVGRSSRRQRGSHRFLFLLFFFFDAFLSVSPRPLRHQATVFCREKMRTKRSRESGFDPRQREREHERKRETKKKLIDDKSGVDFPSSFVT